MNSIDLTVEELCRLWMIANDAEGSMFACDELERKLEYMIDQKSARPLTDFERTEIGRKHRSSNNPQVPV